VRDVAGDRLVGAHIYDKPEPEDIFGRDDWEVASRVRGNWRNRGNTQVLINHHKLGEHLQSQCLLERYDVFVFTRADMLHLLSFPSLEQMLVVLGPRDALTQAGHEFGGVNYNLVVIRACLAGEYLRAPAQLIAEKVLPDRKTLNIERFVGLVFSTRHWRNLRMPVTCFITAEALGDRSTWRKIQAAPQRDGVLFKYEPQMEEAHRNVDRWQRCAGWRALNPPRRFAVEERHGRAERPYGFILDTSDVRSDELLATHQWQPGKTKKHKQESQPHVHSRCRAAASCLLGPLVGLARLLQGGLWWDHHPALSDPQASGK